jgi:hypothetical protein
MDRLLDADQDNERIVLDLLTSVENALGLVNAYLKRCVNKGLVKVNDAPARRYVYYLTPHGFAEKSRLTVQYLSNSFSFFRTAKSDCAQVLDTAKAGGFNRLVLAGQSDLAEIAILCAVEAAVTIVGVVDPNSQNARFVGTDVFKSYAEVLQHFDAVIVTDVSSPRASFEAAVLALGADRVLAPTLLGLRPLAKVGSAT